MENLFDVLRELVKLLDAGELHDRAVEIIDHAEGKASKALASGPPEGESKPDNAEGTAQ